MFVVHGFGVSYKSRDCARLSQKSEGGNVTNSLRKGDIVRPYTLHECLFLPRCIVLPTKVDNATVGHNVIAPSTYLVTEAILKATANDSDQRPYSPCTYP
jgi:hypothetical protein